MTITVQTTCCGKPMAALGYVDTLMPNREGVQRWICKECGHCLDLIDYHLDEEELKNQLDLYPEHVKPASEQSGISNDRFYPITSLHRDDLRNIFRNRETGEVPAGIARRINDLTDEDMRYLASKMADVFCNCCCWDALKELFLSYAPAVESYSEPQGEKARERAAKGEKEGAS